MRSRFLRRGIRPLWCQTTERPPAVTTEEKRVITYAKGSVLGKKKHPETPLTRNVEFKQRTAKKYERVTTEMIIESDRGCVLVGVSHLEQLLGQMLRSKFKQLSGASNRDLDFLLEKRPLPPLGNFAIRTITAYVLGLIGRTTRRVLDEIRDIRNAMAHKPDPAMLTDDHVAKLITHLPQNVTDIAAQGFKATRTDHVEVIKELAEAKLSQFAMNTIRIPPLSLARWQFITAIWWLEVELEASIRKFQPKSCN